MYHGIAKERKDILKGITGYFIYLVDEFHVMIDLLLIDVQYVYHLRYPLANHCKEMFCFIPVLGQSTTT